MISIINSFPLLSVRNFLQGEEIKRKNSVAVPAKAFFQGGSFQMNEIDEISFKAQYPITWAPGPLRGP